MRTALPLGLIEQFKACRDRLIVLSAQVISNETSNLAESYMAIWALYDGGKQFIHIQSVSFKSHCYAAGMRMQGESWHLEALQKTTGKRA